MRIFLVENDRPEKISNKKDQPCWLGKSSLTQGLKVSILSWNLQTQSGRFEVEGEMGCLGKGFGNFLNLTNTKTKTNTNTLYLGSCDNCLHAILFWKWIIFRKKVSLMKNKIDLLDRKKRLKPLETWGKSWGQIRKFCKVLWIKASTAKLENEPTWKADHGGERWKLVAETACNGKYTKMQFKN